MLCAAKKLVSIVGTGIWLHDVMAGLEVDAHLRSVVWPEFIVHCILVPHVVYLFGWLLPLC